MSSHATVRDYINNTYLTISGDVNEGAAELVRSGLEFGILVDASGHPRILLTLDGQAAPAIIIDARVPMEHVLAEHIIDVLNSGVSGLVVTDGSRTIGVLSAATVSDYLVEHSSSQFGLVGDNELQGDAPVTPLKLTCTTCGAVNTAVFYAAGETQCSNGHLLTLTWD